MPSTLMFIAAALGAVAAVTVTALGLALHFGGAASATSIATHAVLGGLQVYGVAAFGLLYVRTTVRDQTRVWDLIAGGRIEDACKAWDEVVAGGLFKGRGDLRGLGAAGAEGLNYILELRQDIINARLGGNAAGTATDTLTPASLRYMAAIDVSISPGNSPMPPPDLLSRDASNNDSLHMGIVAMDSCDSFGHGIAPACLTRRSSVDMGASYLPDLVSQRTKHPVVPDLRLSRITAHCVIGAPPHLLGRAGPGETGQHLGHAAWLEAVLIGVKPAGGCVVRVMCDTVHVNFGGVTPCTMAGLKSVRYAAGVCHYTQQAENEKDTGAGAYIGVVQGAAQCGHIQYDTKRVPVVLGRLECGATALLAAAREAKALGNVMLDRRVSEDAQGEYLVIPIDVIQYGIDGLPHDAWCLYDRKPVRSPGGSPVQQEWLYEAKDDAVDAAYAAAWQTLRQGDLPRAIEAFSSLSQGSTEGDPMVHAAAGHVLPRLQRYVSECLAATGHYPSEYCRIFRHETFTPRSALPSAPNPSAPNPTPHTKPPARYSYTVRKLRAGALGFTQRSGSISSSDSRASGRSVSAVSATSSSFRSSKVSPTILPNLMRTEDTRGAEA